MQSSVLRQKLEAAFFFYHRTTTRARSPSAELNGKKHWKAAFETSANFQDFKTDLDNMFQSSRNFVRCYYLEETYFIIFCKIRQMFSITLCKKLEFAFLLFPPPNPPRRLVKKRVSTHFHLQRATPKHRRKPNSLNLRTARWTQVVNR